MALDAQEQDQLENYQTMMGPQAGQLALALDQLTDVMAAVGQHTVHCRVDRGPRSGQPPLDILSLLQTLQKAKTLIQTTLLTLRDQP